MMLADGSLCTPKSVVRDDGWEHPGCKSKHRIYSSAAFHLDLVVCRR